MKLLRFLLLFSLFALTTLPTLSAQGQSTMRIEPAEWNFGRINATDGPVKRTFKFTNTGSETFVIERVSTSCGCTSLNYTKNPVPPGGHGTITVEYNPAGRSGISSSDVVIVSRKGLNSNTIHLSGEVIPRPRTVEDDYPFEMASGLRLSTLSLNFGQVAQGEVKSMTVGYYNPTNREIALEFQRPEARPFLKVAAPERICAGCRGEITITYDLTRTTFYGRYNDRIYLIIGGRRQEIPISTAFTAIDAPPADLRKAPVVAISPMFYNFGEARAGAQLTKKITLSNEGTAPLIVRWVSSREGISTTLRAGTVVAAGASVEFSITMAMAAGSSDGVTSGAVIIITNDPERPVREVRLAATLR